MEKNIVFSSDTDIVLKKWKVKPGQSINRGTILATFSPVSGSALTDTIKKYKSDDVGTVIKFNVQEGETLAPGVSAVVIEKCKHPTVMKQMCADCGADLKEILEDEKSGSASVAMVHNIPELVISKEQAIMLGKADQQRLLDQRKLVLLVDLDQTLIHTTNDNIPSNLKDVYHFQLPHGHTNNAWYHSKFRPNTVDFLNTISKLYELHICTFGVRLYAHTIANFLDPDGKLFSHRILSRDECFSANSKTPNLRALFPCGDSMVCIIDDREDVWNFIPNLVHVKPYIFFDATADINAPPGCNKNETNGDECSIKRRKEIVHLIPKSKPQVPVDEAVNVVEKKEANCQNISNTDNKENDKEDLHTEEKDKLSEEKVIISSPQNSDSSDAIMKDNEKDCEPVEKDTSDMEMKEDDASAEIALPANKVTEKTSVVESTTVIMETEATERKDTVDVDESDATMKAEETADENGNGDAESSKVNNVDESDAAMKSEESVVEKDNVNAESSKVNDVDESDAIVKSEETVVNKGDGDAESSNVNESSKSAAKRIDNDSGEKPVEVLASQQVVQEQNEGPPVEYERIVEWEDEDDYLHYLEDVLIKVHKAFFEFYDQLQTKDDEAKKEIPDLKTVIPYMRRKVLKGAHIVFSGVYPTNQPPQRSRAYRIAKSLGADIQVTFVGPGSENSTTHVVAAKAGTVKVNMATKSKSVHVVTPQWLWSCNDRWEWVDERVFPLTDKTQSRNACDSPDVAKVKRKKNQEGSNKDSSQGTDSGCDADISGISTKSEDSKPSSSKEIADRRFSETYNPLYTFSREEIKNMDKEVEDIFDEASDSDTDSESEKQLREIVLGQKRRDSSSEDSMSGDYPRGWKRKRKRADLDEEEQTVEEPIAALAENPHRIFRFSDESSDSGKDDADGESIGSVDEDMAAAVEKEFLA